MQNLEFTYLKQPPKRYTFEQPKLKRWVEKHCKGKVLNLFAGKIRLNVNEIRVDVDPSAIADYHMSAYEFVKTWNGPKFDTVILDPPYNIRKSREKYNGHYIGKLKKLRRILPRILNNKAIIITLGYDTTGMGKGFLKKEICLINHAGDHNDTIALIEEKVGNIDDFIEV